MKQMVSIVMLTRNHAAFTSQCLNSLSLTDHPVEWVVVDNGSTDETLACLEKWEEQGLAPMRIIRNPKDPGSSHARNQGLEAATGDFVLFLDNDTLLDSPDWLTRLAAPLHESGQLQSGEEAAAPIVATAPLLLFPGPQKLIQSAGGAVTANCHVGLLGRGREDGPQWARRREIAWAPTAALLISKRALLEVGGFDRRFDPVSVCEDIDLCCRLRAAGGRILFVGASRIRHFEGITFNHVGYDKRAYWLRHMRIIKNRWRGLLASGPLHSDAEVMWLPVIKDYSDLARPSVHLPTSNESVGDRTHFFAPFLEVDVEPPPPLRVTVIGCGQVALRGALPGFSEPDSEQAALAAPFLSFNGAPDIILSAVCDIDPAKAHTAAKQFDVPYHYTDVEHLLDDIPIEAAVICSPSPSHAGQCLAAIEREVRVLVEKPPVINEVELENLLRKKEERGNCVVMVNLPWVFHPAVEVAAEVIKSGALGPITWVEAVFEHPGPESWSPNARWYREGGVRSLVLDLGLHIATVAERLLGYRTKFLRLDGRQATDERVRARYRVGDVDAIFTAGWDAPGPNFAYNIEGKRASLTIELVPWRNTVNPSSIQVKLNNPFWIGPELSVDDNGRHWLPHVNAPHLGGPYRHFAECIKAKKIPITDLSHVTDATRSVLAWAAESEKR